MAVQISTAMVLAAGLGTRMRHLTDEKPKPLIEVQGKPLIDYALDRFGAAGVQKAIVNIHYRAEQIEGHLESRSSPRVIISDERDNLYETGGALIKALDQFDDLPIFCTNTDAILIDNQTEACHALSRVWRDADMDALLLLCRPGQASGYTGSGDFICANNGQVAWPDRKDQFDEPSFVFTGLQIIHPRLFSDEALRQVSTKLFWDKAMSNGRLYGVVYDGFWMHVGDPEGLVEAERRLASIC